QGGAKVTHKGSIYEAKWWTQNEEPSSGGDASAWKQIGSATVASSSSNTSNTGGKEMDSNLPVKEPTGANDKGFKVIGYYPDWEPDKMDRLQMDILTHINYSFAIPQSDGTIMPLEHPDNAKNVIKKAHQHDVKVLLAVGGWSYKEIPLEPNFISATDSPEKVKKLANAIMAMVKQYGFDGVDMDWEHPRVDGNTSKQYEALMLNLASQLHSQKKLLTSAVLSGVSADGTIMYDAAAHHDSVLNAVDWINVMAYDGGDGERHSSYDFHVNSGNYWIKTRKMNKNKVCVGVPFYGRPSWESYDNILAANPSADKSDISTIKGIQAHYNGVATIEKKSKWNKANCGGVMIWEITQDTTDKQKSLLSTIGRAVK
ncbi:MAG: glycosyl hydrolase family 18 protein, partial [Oscillospiraceae bacterium]